MAEQLRGLKILLLVLFILAGCVPVAPAIEVQALDIYATPAAQPWLAEAYACAPEGIALRVANSPDQAEMTIRLGESDDLPPALAYQIGKEEILVVAHPASPLRDLTIEEARALFARAGASSVEVWVYDAEEDVQAVFEQAVMEERPITSLARLAVGPQHMSEVLTNNPHAVGLLPRRWVTVDLHTLFIVPDVPVLALLRDEPHGALRVLLACLQS
ncbi:MAG: hypothetical protein Fur0043_17970 [Anaerolineales bacterium]